MAIAQSPAPGPVEAGRVCDAPADPLTLVRCRHGGEAAARDPLPATVAGIATGLRTTG